MNYNETLVEKRVTFEELSELFNELVKSHFWIPKFPIECRKHYGFMISLFVLLWVGVFLLIGGTHYVLGGAAFLAGGGALLLGIIVAQFGSYVMNSTLEESYLHDREKDFMKICDSWNLKYKPKGLQIEVGRYGAYLTLEFKKSCNSLGKFLMKATKIKSAMQTLKEEKQALRLEVGQDADQY